MKKHPEIKTGLIHVYCGDGKGKTTAAAGLCIRAAGCGYRVLIAQFMKDGSGNERRVLEGIDGITLMPAPAQVRFSFQMDEAEKKEAAIQCERQLAGLRALAFSGSYDVVLLDEVLYAVRAGFLREEDLLAFLKDRPGHLEVILTGRDPGSRVLAMADYVSEIRKVKHPYEKGIPARAGIEF